MIIHVTALNDGRAIGTRSVVPPVSVSSVSRLLGLIQIIDSSTPQRIHGNISETNFALQASSILFFPETIHLCSTTWGKDCVEFGETPFRGGVRRDIKRKG